MRGGHAGAVGRARSQRFAVSQNVFNEEGGGGSPGGAAGPVERLLLGLWRGRQRQPLHRAVAAAVMVEVVVMEMLREAVRRLHGDRDGGRGARSHSVYLRAWGRGLLAPAEVHCPAVAQPEVPVHERGVRVGRVGQNSVYPKIGPAGRFHNSERGLHNNSDARLSSEEVCVGTKTFIDKERQKKWHKIVANKPRRRREIQATLATPLQYIQRRRKRS